MILRLQRKLQIIRNRRSNMKMKQYVGMFFILSFCLFGEIREVTPLSELSSNILGEKVQKTSKIEKNIPKFSEEQKNTSTILQSLGHSRNISQKDSSQFVDISEQDNRNGIIYRQGEDTAFTGVFALFMGRSEEHTSELQSRQYLVCRLLLEKK